MLISINPNNVPKQPHNLNKHLLQKGFFEVLGGSELAAQRGDFGIKRS